MKRGDKKGLKLKGFSIQFLPYSEIRNLDSDKRIKKVLGIIAGNNILIVQGRLRPDEETRLISDAMSMIKGNFRDFRGVELAVISGSEERNFFSKIKQKMANALSGGDMGTITVIGPATIVKEIKRNPKKIELLLNK